MENTDLKDIYTLLSSIKCDIAGIRVMCPEHTKQIDAINQRVVVCEAVLNKACGMYTLIGVLAGAVGSIVVGVAIHFLTNKQ
jgi:hypothetical protein